MEAAIMQGATTDASAKVVVWLVQLVLGLAIAMGSIFAAMRLLNRLTRGIDEEEELKQGNLAVAAMMLGVIIAVALVTSSGVVALTQAVTEVKEGAGVLEYGRAVGFGAIQLVASIIFAVVSIYLGFMMWGKITTGIDEETELKKRNVAVGIVLAGVVVAVALVVREGVSGLASAISGLGD